MELESPPFMENSIKNSILLFGIFPATSQWVSVSVLDKDGELLYQGPVKSDSVQKIEWENMKIQ